MPGNYPFANESPEERIKRHSTFSPRESLFPDPGVLNNLNVGEDTAYEVMAQARKNYDEDMAAARKKNPKADYSFNRYLEDMASDFSKIDPNSEEGKALNPVGTAELYREFSRLHSRGQARAEHQEIKDIAGRQSAGVNAGLSVFGAAKEFADTASGGLSDVAAEGLNRIVGGEEGAKKYAAGRDFLAQMQEHGNPALRFSKGFGGLLGYITPAGGAAKAATAGRVALIGGETALKQGTWRYGLNKGLATLLGASAEGAGVGSRMAGSAGNFLATEAGLKTVQELSTIAQAKMEGGNWQERLAELHSKPEWDLLQSALSGATMPMLQKVGDRVARMFMGSPGSARRLSILGKSLKEMDNWSLRTQAVFARGAGGSAEFSGLSLLPNLHDPNGPFGVVKDFALLFGEDSDERTRALENLFGHAINGFLLKNIHGKPQNEYTAKDRAAALAPGVDRLGVAEAATAAKRTAEEEASSFFPTPQDLEDLRSNREGAAYQKIGEHITRQYGTAEFGPDAETMPIEELISRFTPEHLGYITNAINDAVRLVGSTGKGIRMELGEGKKPKVVSYSKEEAGRYGLTNDERKAVRAALREIIQQSTPEDRDALATNLISQQSLAEAAAGMGMAEGVEPGAVDKALSGIADSAAESTRTHEAQGVAKPDEAISARQIELEGMYRQIEAAQTHGRLDIAKSIAEKAAALETELDGITKANTKQPEPEPGTAEQPLTPGTKPKPLSEESPGDAVWPEGFGATARGNPVRVLIGETSDKQGIFREGMILHVDDNGMAVVQTHDGRIFAVTPKDVANGAVRGDIFTGLEMPTEAGAAPKVKPEAKNAKDVEHQQIRSRGDTIEPVKGKPAKSGPVQGPNEFVEPVGLLTVGKTDVTPPPAEGSGGVSPKTPPKPSQGPETGAPKVVTPDAAKTNGKVSRFGRRAVPAGSQSGGKSKAAPASTSEVVSPGGTPGKPAGSKPEAPASKDGGALEVPTPEWTAKASTQDIAARLAAIHRFADQLRRDGKAGTPAYLGANKAIGDLSRELYRRKNPKPDTSKEDNAKAEAAFSRMLANAADAQGPKGAKPAEAPGGAKDAPPAASKSPPARLGSGRRKRLATPAEKSLVDALYKGEERRKAAESKANTDELTGLNNQRAFRAALPRVEADPNTHVMVADLKKFKALNDALGQEKGDEALKAAVAVFNDYAKKNNVEPRMRFRSGIGDEFAAIGTKENLDRFSAALNDYVQDFNGHNIAFRSKVAKTYAEAGKVKAAEPVPTPVKAPDLTVRTISGKPTHLTLSDLPEGYRITGAVRSGRSAQIILENAAGDVKVVTTGRQGPRNPPEGWQRPATTKNVAVFGPDGKEMFRGETVVAPEPAQDAPDAETGRIASREQAMVRLGSFRRRMIEKGGESGVTDPIKRIYDTAGALAADPKKSASAAKVMEDDLYRRLVKESEGKGDSDPAIKRLMAAYTAVRRVREAKQYIEELDARIKKEEEMTERSAQAVNPARLIATSDDALSTVQRSARDLAAQFKVKVEDDIERLLAGRKVKDLEPEMQARYSQLHNLRKLAESLILAAPYSQDRGRIDVSSERLPQMNMGDKVQVVTGGKEGSRIISGIVLGSGEASGASMKRGVGTMGQRVREIADNKRRGKILTQAERDLLDSSTQFPGKWVTIATDGGDTVRVRVTDIADIGPESVGDANFSYDPEKKKYGVEVTENRFMSWFSPPEEVSRSRTVAGAGGEEQSIERTQMLLDNEKEGYYVNAENDQRILPGDEAAALEAKNTASHIRNRTARPDQYRYQALAMRVAPEKRKSHVDTLAARTENITTRSEVLATLPAEEAAAIREGEKRGERAPTDTYNIVTHYFKPGTRLRKIEDLSADERREYDKWTTLAEQAESERIVRDQQRDVYEENRKALVPIHTDETHGEWLLQHRNRGESGVFRQGQTLLAERTPEGTIFVRRLSPVEAEAWMDRRGKKGDWETYRANTRRDHKRLIADHNHMIAKATMDTQLRDYMSLLRKQFDEIIRGKKEPFKHEGDLHKLVRSWVAENAPPDKADAKAYEDWLREAESFLFAAPHTERKINVTPKAGAEGESLSQYEATVEQDFLGKPMNVGGPMFRAAERIRLSREPNSGAAIHIDDAGQVKYVNEQDAGRDFYRAAHKESPGIILGVGLGAMPGGFHEAFRRLIDVEKMAFRGADAILRGYHAATRMPATFFTNVMDGVTQFNRGATDAMFFRHLHDLLHHPDYGSGVIGETGKALSRKIGVLFGDSPAAPQMRMYMNDMSGEFYDVATKAANALRVFQQLSPEEQEKQMHEFEEGKLSEPLRMYRDLIDEYGQSLKGLGLFTDATLERFKGKYIHHGRWKWRMEDIENSIRETQEQIDAIKLRNDGSISDIGRLRGHLGMLKNAQAKATKSKGRVFIGDHPLDIVQRAAITDMYRKGFARERQHITMKEAQKKGLDLSVPWLLLMDGLLVEGRAIAQAKMLKRVLSDPTMVMDADLAPQDWIPVEGTRYSQDPIFKNVVGKSIEPQALSLLESSNPDWSKARQVWDMFHGLAKVGLTAGNPTNWHTQMLGNIYTLATRVPFFQIPSRLMSAAITLAGIGKGAADRLEKYRRWNWTHHTNDATREMYALLSKDAAIDLQHQAAGENPYLGMSFFETIQESVKRLTHGHVRSGLRGLAKSGIDLFTAFDAMARIALHEHLTDTMKMPELDSRKIVDNYFDIQHLPKGWQFNRRFFDSFASIRATMGRNLGELVPNSPVAITNLSLLSFFWNAALGALTGTDEDTRKRIIDESIPDNNAFTNWIGRKTALLMPDGKGSLRAVDMNKFSPTDTGIRSIPGARPVTSGVENMLFEGKWADTMEGKGVASNLADFASSNLLYGPTLDWVMDRDRFSEGRGIREQMAEPGAFGSTGYLRYMIERGNLPAMVSMALPPGAREFAAGVAPSGVRALKRMGEASDGGFLGTKPRYVTETKDGMPVARKYDQTDALMETLGFQFSRPDEYARVRESLERSGGVHEGRFGLERDRLNKSPEAKQISKDDESLATMHRGLRMLAQIRHYNSLKDEDDRKVVGEQIKRTVGSVQSFKNMLRQMALMEEYDMLREISTFFEQDKGMTFIPEPEAGADRLTKGRFGTLRDK